MPGLLPEVDPDGLLEYSVVYTDRAVNHMSAQFCGVMNDIARILRTTYRSAAEIIVPGGGTYAMEAVARQYATDANCLVIRNGWFSFRWTQILDKGSIARTTRVLKARRTGSGTTAPFVPAPIDEVIQAINEDKPDLVFAPHVETSAGLMLPDDYLRKVSEAVHVNGGLFVLDCIASGAIWIDMQEVGVDVLISAPQKGWSGSPCAGFVMLSPHALERLGKTASTSFACDLAKWHEIMQAYENGAHAYHATMPTDALRACRDVMAEAEAHGLDALKSSQQDLGDRVRMLLGERGFGSVAAPGYEAPGVVVCYTADPDIANGRKFAEAGMQIAAGVPLRCDEGDDFRTFRLGLFGLDKLLDVDRTVATLDTTLKQIL